MQTLKQLKRYMFQYIKDRYNDFLSEEERYIVENLSSIDKCGEEWDKLSDSEKASYNGYDDFKEEYEIKYPNYSIEKYTEDEACNIVCESLDGLCMNDIESTCWEAGYIKGYEGALIELRDYFSSINLYDESMDKDSKTFTSSKLEDMINNLLIN